MNPGPETGLNARKFGFKARTKYGVYNLHNYSRLNKDTYMVNSPPSLTPLRYLPCDVFNQMVSISNRYARHRLVVILLIIGMISLPNLFQQTLYNKNNTHKIRKLK